MIRREINAVEKAERVEAAKKILSVSDIDAKLLREIMEAIPQNVDVKLFFKDGSYAILSSRDMAEAPRGAEW